MTHIWRHKLCHCWIVS